MSRYLTHSAPHLRKDTLKALQKNSRNWRFGDLHYYLSRRSPSGVIISDVAKPVFLNEDSKNALTKEMVDIASMMKEKLTGCQQQKPKKSGFSFSVCHCQLTKFFTTYFCLQHTVFENHSKQSHLTTMQAIIHLIIFVLKMQMRHLGWIWNTVHNQLKNSFLKDFFQWRLNLCGPQLIWWLSGWWWF